MGRLSQRLRRVERIGMKVSLTRGDRENIKLTTPFDLMVGEAIIRQREGY